MTALLTSLPGDIPGLLLRCSPVVLYGSHGVVQEIRVDLADVSVGDVWFPGEALEDLTLDLTDPTGRWHAAVWAEQAATYADVMEALRHVEHAFYVDAIDAICRAKAAQMMSPTQIDTLARLVLRLAGKPTA